MTSTIIANNLKTHKHPLDVLEDMKRACPAFIRHTPWTKKNWVWCPLCGKDKMEVL
jgi:hypothetical protein